MPFGGLFRFPGPIADRRMGSDKDGHWELLWPAGPSGMWNEARLSCYIPAMLDIFTIGDEVLREKTDEVDTFDSALAMLVDAMFDTLEEADGVGLAAPQVGISKRIFVVDTRQPGERLAFINPVILETSEDSEPYEEGCLSIPGVYHNVMRPSRVRVHAQDVTGKAFTISADRLLARVIQHEYDHLEGRLFTDRLSESEREKTLARYEKMHKSRRKGRK